MPQFVTPREAVSCIRTGDCIGLNSFLSQINPLELTSALAERFREEGAPGRLRVFCPGSFGSWTEDDNAEDFIRSGAVSSVLMSFYSSSPSTAALVMANKLEAYNLPFGVMTHMLRARAGGHDFYLSKVGLNLFLDPKLGGCGLNARSRDNWVDSVEVDGERFLKYRCPKLDVAIIKASGADMYGNISFESEGMVLNALSLAQAVKARGGKVLVQVTRRIDFKQRPWNVIIPAAMVDYICVCPKNEQVVGVDGINPTYSGDEFVEPDMLVQYVSKSGEEPARQLIAERASRELCEGQIVNLGIGIPECVAEAAAKAGILPGFSLTVVTGAFGGMPASGRSFGSSVGAMSICDASMMFDFYDGGGLDVACIGFLQVGSDGSVNGHNSPGKLSGIGGFANITQNTHKVVFCGTFTAGGLKVERRGDEVHIIKEGKYSKFVNSVSAVSFSSVNAHSTHQEILYVTERCVFRLGSSGLELIEVAKGIDLKCDILDKLPFTPVIKLNI